jgi:dolichyldiphosphatase
VGAVTNAFVNKALKYVLNHARPASGLHLKTDPGMPSSHAQSLAYLAGYPALGWLVRAWSPAWLLTRGEGGLHHTVSDTNSYW